MLSKLESKIRFDALDGIRGIAAILVMFYHYSSHAGGQPLFVGAYIAVDLFFILSGFVIMHSYGSKIQNGLSFKQFLLARIIRLYPMFLIGGLIGLVALLNQDNQPNELLIPATLNLLFLPYLNPIDWSFDQDTLKGIIFPLNDPSWSLFFEMFVNLTFFYYILRWRHLKLTYLVASGYVIFILAIVLLQSRNPGWGYAHFIGGFPRVTAEFLMGVLIYQYRHTVIQQIKSKAILISLIAFLIVSVGDYNLSTFNMLIICPLLVFLYAKFEVKKLTASLCAFLGELSYPIYILHVPIYHLLIPITNNFNPTSKIVFISLVTLLTTIMMIPIDRLTRKKLTYLTKK